MAEEPLTVARSLTADDIRRLQEERALGRTDGATVTRPNPARMDGTEPTPEFKPARPEDTYREMMAHMQKWARSSKGSWMVSIGLLRKQNRTATAHMTDEQLYLMLQEKVTDSIKRAYNGLDRDKELQIKIGGF